MDLLVKNISILGATGSIGQNTLDLISSERDKFNVVGLTGENNIELLAIGIGHDVSKYYKRAITNNRAEELGEVLLEELTELFKNQ